jgi:hypothetical protein
METAATISTDSEMTNVGGGGESDSNKARMVTDQADIKEAMVVLDKWSRTCDIVLNSLDEQIKRISKKASSK